MARIELIQVTKKYGSTTAVCEVSLDIADGEFVVLLGPSGCGKSTILKMIAGLEEITHGEIYIADRLVNYVSPGDRDVAMVFQSYALYPHMTAYQNIAFPLRMARQNVAAALLDLVDGDPERGEPPVYPAGGAWRLATPE